MVLAGRQLSRGERRRVGERAHAQRDIHALLDQVDDPVVEHHVQGEIGVRRQELRQVRHDVQSREGDGGADPEAPCQPLAGAARHRLGLVGLLDRPLGALVEALPGLGRRQTVRRAHQQAHAQARLELRHGLGDRRLTHVERPRGRRE
jgi:hypothetical protein